MPRKIDYSSEKAQEIIALLVDLKFAFGKNKDSIDISVKTAEEKRMLMHELHKIFMSYKSPPLTVQYDETSKVLSVFDQRM